MGKIRQFSNKFKTALTIFFMVASFFVIASASITKGNAKSSYTFDGKTIDSEAFGPELPTSSDKVFLTRDFDLNDDYVIPTGQLVRIYMNGHNINLHGHQIRIEGTGALVIYEDRTNPTFFSLDSNGNVIDGNDYVVNGGSITGATDDYAFVIDGSDAHLYLKGANVYGNTAGAVKVVNGKLHLDGGSISCNTAEYGAGVYLDTNGKLAMTGGVIENNIATKNGAGVYQNGYMEVCKESIIRNNKLTTNINNNVYIPDTNTANKAIRVTSGTFTGRIGITSSSDAKLTSYFGYYNNASSTNVADYFFSDIDGKYITASGTGNNQEAIFTSVEPTDHTHNSKTFTKWTSTTSLPTTEGNYYLSKDVKLTSYYNVSGTISIDLNGHSINLNGRYINFYNSSSLSIYDCSKEVHYYDVDNKGLAVLGGNNYKFVGGYIYGATVYRAINLTVNTASFNMYGGALLGNSAGAVKVDRPSTGSAKLYFSNAYIVGNTTEKAADKEGSAIYAGDHEGITLYNTTIQHNKTYTNSGVIWTAGAVSTSARLKVSGVTNITENRDINGNLCNVYIDRQKGHTITVSGTLKDSYDYSQIGVTSNVEDTYFTNEYYNHEALNDPNKYFISDKASLLISKETYNNALTGGTITEAAFSVGHKHDSTTYTTATTPITSTSTSVRYFFLKNDIKLDSDWTIPTGGQIIICLAGHKFDLNGHTIYVPTNSSVKFTDDSKFKSKYYINENGLAVIDETNGTNSFEHSYFYDSKSLASTPTTTNSFFKLNGGTLELENVNIFGSYTNNTGNAADNAAVCVKSGSFKMSNGIIAGCIGKYGSALHLNNANYNAASAAATLTKVKLLNNSGSSGGAIYAYYGTLTMTDSYCLNNKTTTGSGGAIDLNIGAKATISYSYFYNNEAAYDGGAINAYNSDSSTFTKLEFAYNKASGKGGAIYSTAYLTLAYVTCVFNESNDLGGALYVGSSGYFQMEHYALISNNKAKTYGGGIYSIKQISIKDEIIIKDNTANDITNNTTFFKSSSSEVNFYMAGVLKNNAKIGVTRIKKVNNVYQYEEGLITSYYGNIMGTTAPSTYFFSDLEGAALELRYNSNYSDNEIYFVPPHYHTIAYTSSGNKLTAKCSECSETIATLTVTGGTYTYDKQAHAVTANLDEFAQLTGTNPTVAIYYYPTGTTSYTTTAPTNAGTYSVNYNVTIGSTTYYLTTSLTINKRVITVSGLTAQAKEYDGTTNVIISSTGMTYSNLVAGDSMQINVTASFVDKNYGFNKTVNITNITFFNSSYGKNYTIDVANSQKTTTGIILQKTITVTGITGVNKVYDGTTTGELNFSNATFVGMVSGDSLTITGTGTFASKDVATGITVNLSNLTLGGDSKGNYSLDKSKSQTKTSADITKKAVTVSGITGINKEYDGVTGVEVSTTNAVFNGKVSGDSLTITATGEFDTINVGNNKTVNIILGSLGGDSVGNYMLATSGNQETTTANITPKAITISGVKANNKIYDGTKTATLKFEDIVIVDLVGEEQVTVSATGSFKTVNVATNIIVNITGYVLSGTYAENYTVSTSSQETTTASITAKEVTVSGIKANNKVYDGNTSVTFNYDDVVFAGIVGEDSLTVIAEGAFENASYGTNKIVTITNITLGGDSLANYVLATTGNQTTSEASITKDVMTVNAVAYSGNYDKQSHSMNVTGIPSGSTITFSTDGINYSSERPSFVDAGTYKVYYLIQNDNYEDYNGNINIVINKKRIAVSNLGVEDKVYDGTTNATFNYTTFIAAGVISGDDISIDAKGNFASKNVGSNITVTYTYVLSGDSKNNYYLSATAGTLTANITRKGITISNIKVNTKNYDGTTDAVLDLTDVSYDGIIENDDLSITVDAAFVDSSIGENKVVNLTNLTLVGADKGNYYLKDDCQAEATATILRALMTAVIEGYTGDYDKEAHSITITETLPGATITYSEEINGQYSTQNISYINAGSYIIYFKIEKDDYETIYGNETIVINKKEVNVSGIKANNKVYDGNTDVEFDLNNLTIDGIIDGDTLTVTANGSFESKNVGNNKVVNITNLTLSNSNYALSNDSQTRTNASITSKKIVITNIKILDKTYDETTDAEIDYNKVLITGLVDGDEVTIKANAQFVDGEVGEDKKVIISDISLEGEDQANYEIEVNQIETIGNIVKAPSKANTNKGLSGGAITGIIIGAILVSGLIGFALYWFIFKKKKA